MIQNRGYPGASLKRKKGVATMKRQLGFGFLGIVAVLAGCSGANDTQSQSAVTQPAAISKPQEFSKPLVAQAPAGKNAPAVPGLLQPTNAKARLPGIAFGRRDPFAAVPGTAVPIVISSSPNTKPVSPLTGGGIAPLPTTKLPQISLPPVASAPLPTLPAPTVLPPMNSGALPPVNLPNAAPPRPTKTSLAEAIEVNGVVQVSGKWNVIVREPNASSSRHVAVGDYLENGKVLVKKIVAPGTTGPTVVLQQNGVEIRKSVV